MKYFLHALARGPSGTSFDRDRFVGQTNSLVPALLLRSFSSSTIARPRQWNPIIGLLKAFLLGVFLFNGLLSPVLADPVASTKKYLLRNSPVFDSTLAAACQRFDQSLGGYSANSGVCTREIYVPPSVSLETSTTTFSCTGLWQYVTRASVPGCPIVSVDFEQPALWDGEIRYSCPFGSQITSDIRVCSCPAGKIVDASGTLCVWPHVGKNLGQPCPHCGTNPIHPGIGNKYQLEQDYVGTGSFPLRGERSYNSLSSQHRAFGMNWRGYYERSVNTASPGLADMLVARPDGKTYTFSPSGESWSPHADVNDKLVRLIDSAGNPAGWRYTSADDIVEVYDMHGLLLSLTTPAGQVQALTYSDGTASGPNGGVAVDTLNPLPQGLLIRVTDAFGRQLQFSYDVAGRIVKMTDPAGRIYTYTYHANNNVASVTYPDNVTRTYLYNEQPFTQNTNLPNALTGLLDENGARFATWGYDVKGRAVSSEHAGGNAKVTLNYTVDINAHIFTNPVPGAVTVATDALGTTRSYTFNTVLGTIRSTGVDGPCASCGNSKVFTYDPNGNVSSRTDFNGNVTKYGYDISRNLEASRTEGFGTAQARTTTTAWHPTYRLPTKVAEPLRLTTHTYDPKGNLLNRTVRITADAAGSQGMSATPVGTPRTWRYTYNDVGQVLTSTGPRTDLDDTFRYAYDAATGNLVAVTNAAGHVTTLTGYDANGRVGKIIDANGLTTALQYSPRGWLTSRVVSGKSSIETTGYEYDGVGQLKKVNLPDGAWIGYDYDDAHRLTDTYDSLGNRITYTLDAMGNRLSEQVTDPSGALARQTTRVYDALNRLQKVTGGTQ